MSRIFIPTKEAEDWQRLLAEPIKHWKTGCSAKSLACCWQEANGFPASVRKVFTASGIPLFRDIELLLAFPEYQVPLPGGSHASQNDLFVLAKGSNQLVSIMVEGKVSEPFGLTVGEWMKNPSPGKQQRLGFLLNELHLGNAPVDDIRYQLFHRTVSAILEAKKFNASSALMLVHSFSTVNLWFDDYCQFLMRFGLVGKVDFISGPVNLNGLDLYFGWVKGDPQYLTK